MRTSNPPRTRIRENILEMREKGERKLRIQRHSRKSVQESRGLLNAQDLQYLLWQITRPFPSLRDLHFCFLWIVDIHRGTVVRVQNSVVHAGIFSDKEISINIFPSVCTDQQSIPKELR
jgi:hypothetical protein